MQTEDLVNLQLNNAHAVAKDHTAEKRCCMSPMSTKGTSSFMPANQISFRYLTRRSVRYYTVTDMSKTSWLAQVESNTKPTLFKLDTVAKVTAISLDTH